MTCSASLVLVVYTRRSIRPLDADTYTQRDRAREEMATQSELKAVMDPVHGSIQLENYLFKIIDQPQFQRLRKIKQLGGVCYVYPGATHTRFEHSIGVCYIAGQLVDALNRDDQGKDNKDKKITSCEKKCIQIAALCHDLGHGPYSHLHDAAVKEHFKKKPATLEAPKSRHEYRSAELVKDVMIPVKEDFGTDAEAEIAWTTCINLVEDIITFSERYKEYEEKKEKFKNDAEKSKANEEEMKSFWDKKIPPLQDKSYKEKPYLFEIVANGFTGIDVDKMDYFARDSHSVGLPNNFDWRRFTQTAKIIKCDDGLEHICSRDKDALNFYELFHTRNLLHRTVYWHKTVAVIQEMMLQALIAAATVVLINDKPVLECWEELESFLLLDDTIEDYIMKKVEDNSGTLCIKDGADGNDARKFFCRIKERKIWKFVGRSKRLDMKEEEVAICVAKERANIDAIKKNLKKIETKFNYGKGKSNPMESHNFYGKKFQKHPFHLPKEEVSEFLPQHFEEKEVLWYYNSEEHDNERTGARADEVITALWEFFNINRLVLPFKCALEGSYARKKEIYKTAAFSTDEDLTNFNAIIEKYQNEA